MKQATKLIATLAICTTLGCATKPKGFDRDSLAKQITASQPVFDEKTIKDVYNKKPNLPKPFRVAIYFIDPRHDARSVDWRWNAEDKEFSKPVFEQLQKQGLVSDYFPLLRSLVHDESLKSLRLAAARQGADALLVIDGITQFDKYVNSWGATYFLLLPALFVPGSEVDTLFVTSAALWDVKNEYLYLATEAEASVNHQYIAAFGKRDAELIDEAKAKSLGSLKEQIASSVQGRKL